MKQYCAASQEDSENFDNDWDTWWGSAICWFEDNEEEHQEQAEGAASTRGVPADAVNDNDRRAVTCAVGRVRNPVSPALMFRDAGDARDFLIRMTENHDDYQGDWGADEYPKATDEQLKDLAQELRCTIQEWEARHKTAPHWFMVDGAVEITYGLAKDADALADEIDKRLTRYEHDRARWWPPEAQHPVEDDGKAIEIKTLDLWQAAALLGLPAPEKPKRLP